jgi:hypothetical protein
MTSRTHLLAMTAVAGLLATPVLAQQGGSAGGGSSMQPQTTQTTPQQGPLGGSPAARGGATGGAGTAVTQPGATGSVAPRPPQTETTVGTVPPQPPAGGATQGGGAEATGAQPGSAATGGAGPDRGAAAPAPGGRAAETPAAALGAEAAALRNARRATKVIGSSVYNEGNESIGEVDDILIPPPGGGEPVAVLSVGGFLGIGARLVAVPYERLQWDAQNNRLVMPGASRDTLNALPRFSYDAVAAPRG